MSARIHTASAVLLAALCVAGCGGDLGVSLGSEDKTGSLGSEEGVIPMATAPYLVLDIATGTVTARAAVSDLASNAAYRNSQMVFRRVDPSGVGEFLVGVFEVTQGQWVALGGGTPWSGVDAGLVGAGAVGATKPAFALSADDIQPVLSAYASAQGVDLRLPTDAQWMGACAAGSGGAWSWGDASDRGTVAARAVVWETIGGTIGPRDVGVLLPNAYGLYDMHGNVWEWVASGDGVRGGSWHDALVLARTANKATFTDAGIISSSAHALFGLRLVLRP